MSLKVFLLLFYCLGIKGNSRSVLLLVIVLKLNRCHLTTKKRGFLRKDAAHIVRTRRSRHPDIHVSSDVSYTTCKQAYSQVFRVCALITFTRALPQLQLQGRFLQPRGISRKMAWSLPPRRHGTATWYHRYLSHWSTISFGLFDEIIFS